MIKADGLQQFKTGGKATTPRTEFVGRRSLLPGNKRFICSINYIQTCLAIHNRCREEGSKPGNLSPASATAPKGPCQGGGGSRSPLRSQRDGSARQSSGSILVLLQIFCRGEWAVGGACLGINTPGDFPGGRRRWNVKVKTSCWQRGFGCIKRHRRGAELCHGNRSLSRMGGNPRESAVGATKMSVGDSNPTRDAATTTPARWVPAARGRAWLLYHIKCKKPLSSIHGL